MMAISGIRFWKKFNFWRVCKFMMDRWKAKIAAVNDAKCVSLTDCLSVHWKIIFYKAHHTPNCARYRTRGVPAPLRNFLTSGGLKTHFLPSKNCSLPQPAPWGFGENYVPTPSSSRTQFKVWSSLLPLSSNVVCTQSRTLGPFCVKRHPIE